MHRVFTRLRSTVAALLVAVLVIVPVADAFACSFESGEAHATVAVDDHAAASHDDAGKGDAPDGSHGACAHNHCHHSTANLPSSAAVGYDAARVLRPVPQDSTRAFGLSEGPMRPPRS